MPNYAVTACQLSSNVAVLTLDSVGGLYAGYPLEVEGVGAVFDGTHTVSTVDVTAVTVSYPVSHADIPSTDAAGAARIPISWVYVDDVLQFLGLQPADPDDLQYLTDCTDAANEWAYDRRRSFNYVDRPTFAPDNRVKLGTVLYAATLYRERGSIDSFSSFQNMETAQPIASSLGQIYRLLGLQKAVVA